MDFGDGQMGDIPTRPMRVKILYTFDQENKTNCLARFPEVLQIPAVAIDESSQVGVIELKQCLQAIVAASPELIPRLADGDFTIYAFDYSEYDTPLVGQGMLSAALSNAASMQPSKSMITGRVCKNVMGLFSNGVKETLEVKLRLTPVPKPAQTDFTKMLDGMRGISPALSGGFDPNAWNASMQFYKPQNQSNDYFNIDALANSGSRDMAMADDMFGLGSVSSGCGGGAQMTGGMGIVETPTDALPNFNPAFAAHPHSAPGSRAGSPMMGPDPSTRNELLRHQSFSGNPSINTPEQSRPGSRASVRSESLPSHQRHGSAPSFEQPQTSTKQTEVYYNEDGQPRKRAKVQQADWRGRSSFGSKSADLRVTAATAASMHMHRPIPKRPVAPGSGLEPPPRVPTPVPQRTQMMHQQQHVAPPRRSMLRQASQVDSDIMSDFETHSDAIVSSPEDDSPGNSATAEGTPQDIPSSPPVFAGINLPTPSSPGLPTLPPRMADSGYMSEKGFHSSNAFEMMDNEEDRSPDELDYEMASQYQARRKPPSQPFIKTEGDGSGMLLDNDTGAPHGGLQVQNGNGSGRRPQQEWHNAGQGPASSSLKRYAASEQLPHTSGTRATTPAAQSGSRRGSLALPPNPIASSDLPNMPVQRRPPPKKRQSIQRSRTKWNESEAGSPVGSDNEGRSRPYIRSGSGAQRRKVIEQRLEKSIANGEMPKYCSHCGAIETSTWRRLYVREFEGKPSPLDEAEGEGETIGVEVTENDEVTGDPTRYIIRKSMKKTKETQPGVGFQDVVVCNPCGLWFNKFRVMRPPEKWGRKPSTRKFKKDKSSMEPGMATDGVEPQSDMFFTDQPGPEEAVNDADVEVEGAPATTQQISQAPSRRPRASSLQLERSAQGRKSDWNASRLDAALARAVQSSPARFNGSHHSPIEIDDLTPNPTRRLLFPSPRKEGEVKSLDDNAQASLKATIPGSPGLSDKEGLDININADTTIFKAHISEKENMAPPLDDDGCDDDFGHLFAGSPSAFFKTPRKTPAKSMTSPRSLRQLSHLLKTPTPNRTNKRVPLTPNANAANVNSGSNAAMMNDFMTSPSSNRYFLRSTPSRLERTGDTPAKTSNNASPWSRQVAQMLSDVTGNGSNQSTSPSQAVFDFSDLPSFTSPGGRIAPEFGDWDGFDNLLSSEFAEFQDGGAQGDGGE